MVEKADGEEIKNILKYIAIKSEEQKCSKCDDCGALFNDVDGIRTYAGQCECQVPIYNEKVWKYIYSKIPYNLQENISDNLKSESNFTENQIAALKKMSKKNWVYGLSGVGKSHLILERIRIRLKSEKTKFIKARYYDGEDFDKLFVDQYSNHHSRAELENLNNLDILYIDDIGKIGAMTSHKANQLFSMFNKKIDKIPNIEISDNNSCKDFCNRIDDPTVSAPMYRRLMQFITPNEIELK